MVNFYLFFYLKMKVAIMQGHIKAQIVFFYNTSVIEAIKTIKGWSFDMVCKKWYISREGEQLMAYQRRQHWTILQCMQNKQHQNWINFNYPFNYKTCKFIILEFRIKLYCCFVLLFLLLVWVLKNVLKIKNFGKSCN